MRGGAWSAVVAPGDPEGGRYVPGAGPARVGIGYMEGASERFLREADLLTCRGEAFQQGFQRAVVLEAQA